MNLTLLEMRSIHETSSYIYLILNIIYYKSKFNLCDHVQGLVVVLLHDLLDLGGHTIILYDLVDPTLQLPPRLLLALLDGARTTQHLESINKCTYPYANPLTIQGVHE